MPNSKFKSPYITLEEVIEAKKVADRWGLPDPFPNISIPMDEDWIKLKYGKSTGEKS